MEPISRPPRQKPTSHPLIYYPAAIFFISSITFTCIALISLQVASVVILASQYPLLLFVPRNSHLKMRVWFYQQYKSVIRLTEKSFGLQLALVCWVLLPKQKLVLTGDYKSLDSVEKAILIANHQIYLDWFYIWLLAVRFERHGDLKIMLIAIMKHVPLFGLGMQFFEFIFMKQKLALDQQNILNHMDHLRDYCQGFPLWLLIFPEGTLNTPKNRKSSREYAKKNDIKEEPKVFFFTQIVCTSTESYWSFHVFKGIARSSRYNI
jgi:1-acyl-sn-glycerol-3-phosphate acyltransferase